MSISPKTCKKCKAKSIYEAAKTGHVSCVNLLINSGADVNGVNSEGDTVLFAAIDSGNCECVKELIKAGADVNQIVQNESDGRFRTALIYASEIGQSKCIDILVEAGADMNIQTSDREYSAVMYAAERGNHRCLDKLIKSGADVNLVTKFRDTAVNCACTHDRVKCLELLIKAGAGVNHKNSHTYTPLVQVSNYDYLRCAQILIAAGADVNIITGRGPAIVGAAQGSLPIMRILLRAGAQMNLAYSRNNLSWMNIISKEQHSKLLFAAGEEIAYSDGSLPVHLQYRDLKLNLKHLCRLSIRKHLLELDPHQHLFERIPQLGLPSSVNEFLLYGESLNVDEDEENSAEVSCSDTDENSGIDDADELEPWAFAEKFMF